MEAVGLSGFERRSIDTLSVGQFQRVLFARLLLQDADLVLLDEPFAAIDSKTVADLMRVIERWRDEKRTVVAVLHDLDQVKREFPHTLLLAREPQRAGGEGGRGGGSMLGAFRTLLRIPVVRVVLAMAMLASPTPTAPRRWPIWRTSSKPATA